MEGGRATDLASQIGTRTVALGVLWMGLYQLLAISLSSVLVASRAMEWALRIGDLTLFALLTKLNPLLVL